MKNESINKCKAPDFIFNMTEINSYYGARKKLSVITNGPRIINVLKIYFETLIYYINNSPSKFIVNIQGRQYEAGINAHDGDGQRVTLDLEEVSEQLIKDVISDLAKTLNLNLFNQLVLVLNSALITPQIGLRHKISIINGEYRLPEGAWYTLVRQLPEKIALETVKIRRSFIFHVLDNTASLLSDPEHIAQNILAVHKAYELYIKALLRIHISNNHYDEIISTIHQELNDILARLSNKYLELNNLVTFLLTQLVLNNNLFQIEKVSTLRDEIAEYSDYIVKERSQIIYDGLEFNPQNFELDKLSIGLVEPDFSKEDLANIKTIITFVVPYASEGNISSHILEDKTRIEFNRIDNLLEDPIYSFLDSSDVSINGMPLTFLTDSIGNIGRSTKVEIFLDEFYHPDFDIVENRIVPVDLNREEAKRGGRYFPHKDLILDKLWQLCHKQSFPFGIDIKEIDSNFISNYLVIYIGKDSKLVHHKLFTITNFDSYFKTKNRFISNLNKLYLSEDIPDIRDFVLNTRIVNKKSFLDFCYRLIEISLKKAIEYGGLHNAFWQEKDGAYIPILETKAQPIIYNQLRFLAELKGIRMSREIIASDGSLDFHFSFNKYDLLMNVCVELKNAHNASLEHGLTTQLPLYIKDVGSREGIFLVLWYKSANFTNPGKFNTRKDLEAFLLEKTPKKYNIKPMIIDCSCKVSPSVAGSATRLGA